MCLDDEYVTALLVGKLGAEAFATAELHLDACRRCRLLVSTLAARTGDTFGEGSLSAFGPGDVVAGRYRIGSLLGAGGMGEVYEAFDLVLSETVALKTIASRMAIDDAGVARLKAEVQVARRVTHRNVCRVFDVGFHADGQDSTLTMPFFTMELLAGQTLRTRLARQGRLSPDEALPVVEQMAAGLDAAHAKGVVHGDLKSDNVMVVVEGDDTRVVIMDFGLAHQTEEQARRYLPLMMQEASQGERGELLAGTIAYMAPEQLERKGSGRASDIYALGVVLFELLSGELPFRPTEILSLRARGGQRPRLQPGALPSVPAAWDAAIRRCLELSPEARFASAGELLSALRPPPARRPAPLRSFKRFSVASALTIGLAVAATALVPQAANAPAAPSPEVSPTPLAGAIVPPATPPAAAEESVVTATGAAPPRRPRSRRVRTARPTAATTTPASAVAPAPRLGKDDFVDPFEGR